MSDGQGEGYRYCEGWGGGGLVDGHRTTMYAADMGGRWQEGWNATIVTVPKMRSAELVSGLPVITTFCYSKSAMNPPCEVRTEQVLSYTVTKALRFAEYPVVRASMDFPKPSLSQSCPTRTKAAALKRNFPKCPYLCGHILLRRLRPSIGARVRAAKL